MRAPNPRVAWSLGRVGRRHRYADYIDSPQWWARRDRWLQEWRDHYDHDPACLVCSRPWTLRTGDLHHATYERLTDESFSDLVPLCREHHTQLHDLYDHTPAWRTLGRRSATAGIIAVLRRTVETSQAAL